MANDVTSKVILGLDPSEFRRGIQQVDARLKQTSKLMGNLGQAVGAAFVVSQVQAFASEAIKLGSELQTVSKGFARFGNEMQLEQLRKSTRGLVTDLELMKVTVQAGNFGIPIEQMGKLLEFAARRAAETGQSVDYLVNSIVTGIGRKSPLILDNLGISTTRLKEKFHGAALEAQSIADVAEAVGEIATEELAKMGDSVDTATDKMQRLATTWQNFKANFGEAVAPASSVTLDFFNKLLNFKQTMSPALSRLAVRTNIDKPSSLIKKQGPAAPTVAPVVEIQRSITTLESLRQKLKELQDEYNNTELGTRRFNELKVAIEKVNEQIERATTIYWNVKESTIELNDKGLKPVTDELTYQDMVLRSSIIPAYDDFTRMIKGAQEQLAIQAEQLQYASAVGAEFGYIISSAFSAAINNGTNFFDEMHNALKNYISQMAVAVAITAALAAIISLLSGGTFTFAKAFKGVAAGTGIGNIFGEGGIIELFTTLKGFDLQANSNRVNGVLNLTR